MKLVDFAVDCEYFGLKKYLEQSIKERGWSENDVRAEEFRRNEAFKRREFELQTRCICALFSRLLGKYETEDTKALRVLCVEKTEGAEMLTLYGGFCRIQAYFDYTAFTALDDFGKKKAILEVLMKGIRRVAVMKNWKIEPFECVYEQIIKTNYVNEWYWGKPKQSPDGKCKAKLFLQHELREIVMSIVVVDRKDNELKRQAILVEEPSEYQYVQHLGELKWLDNETVALFHKYNNEKKCLHI